MTPSTPENVSTSSVPSGTKSQSGKTNATTTTTSSKDGNTLVALVALVDPTAVLASTTSSSSGGRHGHDEVYTPLRLACPRTNQVKDYMYLQISTNTCNNTILEVQALDDESTSTSKQYSSWFVGNTVVSNGKLYVMTRVDPLFFVVAKAPVVAVGEAGEKTKPAQSQWQPLDQLLHELQVAEPIQRLLLLLDHSTAKPNQAQTQKQTQTPLQLLHLCDSYEIDDDETFYKFSHTKTLAWLQKKQTAVYNVLLQQLVQESQRKAAVATTMVGGGAVCEGFTLPTNSSLRGSTTSTTSTTTTTKDTSDKNTPTPQQQEQATQESIQIVCNYLSPPWQTAFLDHLNQPLSVLKPADFDNGNSDKADAKKIKTQQDAIIANAAARDEAFHAYVTTATTINASTNMVTPAPPPPKPKLSFGQKQLLKVSKKGMKPMTSFFAPKPAKK